MLTVKTHGGTQDCSSQVLPSPRLAIRLHQQLARRLHSAFHPAARQHPPGHPKAGYPARSRPDRIITWVPRPCHRLVGAASGARLYAQPGNGGAERSARFSAGEVSG
jgi:hypothetical protein